MAKDVREERARIVFRMGHGVRICASWGGEIYGGSYGNESSDSDRRRVRTGGNGRSAKGAGCASCPRDGRVRVWNFHEWAEYYRLDVPLESALVRDFDALLLPGVVINPDVLRIEKKAVAFVKGFLGGRKAGGGDLPRAVDGD